MWFDTDQCVSQRDSRYMTLKSVRRLWRSPSPVLECGLPRHERGGNEAASKRQVPDRRFEARSLLSPLSASAVLARVMRV
jgi:hypothetical protein